MKRPRQLKIVFCILSGIKRPIVSPIVPPISTAMELKTVPPAGMVLKISSMVMKNCSFVFSRNYNVIESGIPKIFT